MGKDGSAGGLTDAAKRRKQEEYDNSFSTYLWNSQTGQVLGRTGTAWAKLIIFYLIFYAGLASFFGLYFYIFYQTLSEESPKWTLDDSLIGSNPGLGYRPMPDPDNNPESTLIWYKQNNTDDTRFWYKQLEDYLSKVENPDIEDDVINCSYNISQATRKESCRVDVSDFGPCSKGNKFGYPTGEPCILLKLNKIFSWQPEGFGLDSNRRYDEALLKRELNEKVQNGMPAELRDFILKGVKNHTSHIEKYLSTVWISCEGEGVNDKENIGAISYYPQPGIPGYFFPYYKQKGYQSPFIFIQLNAPQHGVLLNIECKAWARNIKQDRVNRLGSVHFELIIDQDSS